MADDLDEINDNPLEKLKDEDKRKRAEWLAPFQYKKGQSGNPSGRPPGVVSMKEYAKRKLLSMTDEEREEFFNGLDKRTIWEMAEGKPTTDNKFDLTPETIKAINYLVPTPPPTNGDHPQTNP